MKQIFASPFLLVVDETVEVRHVVPHGRLQQHTDISAPQVIQEIPKIPQKLPHERTPERIMGENVHVPVPQIQKEIFEVIQPFLQERICECIVEQIISVPNSGTIRRCERHPSGARPTMHSGAHLWCFRSTDCGRDRASYGGREHCPCFSRGRTACSSLQALRLEQSQCFETREWSFPMIAPEGTCESLADPKGLREGKHRRRGNEMCIREGSDGSTGDVPT